MATFYGNIQKSTAEPPFNPIDANTIAQWRFENDFLDSGDNGFDFGVNGSVPFSTSNGVWDGTYSVGPFNGNLINSASKGLAGTSGWTVEGYSQFVATGSQYLVMCGQDIPDQFAILYHLGSIRLIIDDAIRVSGPAISVGVKYYWAMKSIGNNDLEFYWNVAGAETTFIGTATGAGFGVWPASDVVLLSANYWSPGIWPFTGYHDYVTVSDIARPTLPTPRPE